MAPPADRKDTSSSVKAGNGIHASNPYSLRHALRGPESSRGQTSIVREEVIPGGYQLHALSLLSHLGTHN